MLSIFSSLENSCSLLFFCLKSHSEAYSELCQTPKRKLLPKIINGFWPLNIFTKNFILDVWQVLIRPLSFLVKLQAFSLQPTISLKNGLLHRYFSRVLATCQEHLWTAASKETDVIKSAVKAYESLYKRCGITPHFLCLF